MLEVPTLIVINNNVTVVTKGPTWIIAAFKIVAGLALTAALKEVSGLI